MESGGVSSLVLKQLDPIPWQQSLHPMRKPSLLAPVDPSRIHSCEEQRRHGRLKRTLAESTTGRLVMSGYETLKNAGTIVCLSPWGDSSPLILPSIRFRDLVLETVMSATGGTATIVTPVFEEMADAAIDTLADTIAVDMGVEAGAFIVSTAVDELIGEIVDKVIPLHASQLETTTVKKMKITLKYEHVMSDAALGFFRSSVHSDRNLYSNMKDYLNTNKGWFSPYMFASGRRPAIPRAMKPDVIFAHGPFLPGDYSVGQTLLAKSALTINLAPKVTSLEQVGPRRLIVVVVGLKPHRKMWTASQRPAESVLHYQLLDGCPAIVLPLQEGSPLISWLGYTLTQLWEIKIPLPDHKAGALNASGHTQSGTSRDHLEPVENTFEGLCSILCEYLNLCIDYSRVEILKKGWAMEAYKRMAVHQAVALFLAAAVRSGQSPNVRKEVDGDRAGIAMWRIP